MGEGTFQPPCHTLHYHMVLRPNGTSDNQRVSQTPQPLDPPLPRLYIDTLIAHSPGYLLVFYTTRHNDAASGSLARAFAFWFWQVSPPCTEGGPGS